MSTAHRWLLVAGLVGTALVMAAAGPRPGPAPAPGPATGLELRGKFVGPTATADAAALAALTGSLADCIEYDGTLATPNLTTATAFDHLRTRARNVQLRGASLGDRHPRARDAIAGYLEAKLGTAGGPVTPEARADWVAALRAISEAAANAAR